jgi:hypothetical protein
MSNQAGLGIGDIVHNQEINEYPEDWKREYVRVSRWVKYTARTLGGGLVIRIVDPQSLVGMWNLIRHRIRDYPTLIINGQERYAGWEASDDAYARLQELLSVS